MPNLEPKPVHILWAQHPQRPHEGYVYEIFKSEQDMKAAFQGLAKKTTSSGFLLNMCVKYYTAATAEVVKCILRERKTAFVSYDRNKKEAFENILQNFDTKFEDLWKIERRGEILYVIQSAIDSEERIEELKKIEALLLDALLTEKLQVYGELVYMATKVWEVFCKKWALSKVKTYLQILEEELLTV